MKLVNIVKTILQEKKGDTYDTGCVMLYFNFPQLEDIQAEIQEDDLYTEEGDRTYGLENEPHITLLFGLDPSVQLDDVVDVLEDFTFGKTLIKAPSLFENEKYDVLKFDVEGPAIVEANQALRNQLPYKNDFPDYHPHLTIGYIKSGKGQEYVDKFSDEQYQLLPKYALFSQPDGKKHKITIKVKK